MFVRQSYIGRNRGDGLMYGTVVVGIFVSGSLTSPGLLWTGFDAQCPATFAESPDGILLIANGINPTLRWDGVTRTAIEAGVKPPTAAPVMSADGSQTATTTDDLFETIQFDFTSYGKKVSSASSAARQAKWSEYEARIRATTNSSITSSDMLGRTPATKYFIIHDYFLGNTGAGLGAARPGTLLTTAMWHFTKFTVRLLKNAISGDAELINGRYVAFLRFVDRWGNPSNPSPLTNDQLFTDATTITYSLVEVPTEDRVLNGGRREIWRTAAGEAETFFKDVDTDDMTSTTFTSTKTDTQLELQESMAAFSENGDFLINVYSPPPTSKPYIAACQNRMIAAGDRPWRKGMVSVTYGSTTVTGVSTDFPAALRGRFFYTPDVKAPIEILSVDSASQLTLVSAYPGPTDKFLPYAVRVDATRGNVDFSQPASASMRTGPESWSVFDAVAIAEENDEQTGLVTYNGYSYLLKRRSIWRLSFDDFGLDTIPLAKPVLRRGCVNQQCAVEADGTVFMLDELGIHAFTGESTTQISGPIQDLFREGGIFWGHSCRFHGVHCPDRHLIRWFVTLSGVERPRHAICFHYRLGRWWLEEYPHGVTASVLATINHRLRPVVALETGDLCAMDVGSLDLVDAQAGTTRLSPTAVGLVSVTTTETLPATLVGSPIGVCSGEGRGQWRIIVGVSGGVITVDQPWLELPDTSSVLQIGGVRWYWRSGQFQRAVSEQSIPSGVWMQYTSTTNESLIEVRTYRDASPTAEVQAQDLDSDNVTSVVGDDAVMVQLQQPGVEEIRLRGAARINRDRWQERDIPTLNCLELELAGFSGDEKTVVQQLTIVGAQSKG